MRKAKMMMRFDLKIFLHRYKLQGMPFVTVCPSPFRGRSEYRLQIKLKLDILGLLCFSVLLSALIILSHQLVSERQIHFLFF